ncbi:MAG: phage holin family protein [Pseudomonadota bacterium]|nr:phage holin family protein [Pseudomonadota bacterium]
MSEKTPGASKGLLESLSTLAATLVAIAHTRLDLLSADLEEEREHFISLLVLALAALFCLGVGVLLATLLLVVAFWDTYRLLVLGMLAGLFLAAGIAVWRFALYKARTKPRVFAASMSELLKDRQQLVSRS